jgi:peptide/nickel transport system substrate-binding protein
MTRWQEQTFARRIVATLLGLIVLTGTARCNRSGPITPPNTTLRVGLGGVPQLTNQSGLQQYLGNLSIEGLVAPYEDGRPRPWLAERWETSPDGLTLTVLLRRNARFHDGKPVTASVVAEVLRDTLPKLMGRSFQEDVEQITAPDDFHIQIRLHQSSRLLIESLEIGIREPRNTNVGTGPYLVPVGSPNQLQASQDYYLGQPKIDRIVFHTYPTVRTAWAELLRGNLDMLYEVNLDALDSLQAASNVSVFSYLRHYQYVVMFGRRASDFKSAAIRREVNAAIDRNGIIHDVLNDHGIASVGPVPPQHWALDKSAPRLEFDPVLSKNLASRKLRFTCLVAADSVYERIALALKQQLAAASVDMRIQEVTQDEIIQAGKSKDFEALLIDVISGPSMFRSFRQYYSRAPFDLKPVGNSSIDAALDRIRHAPSDEEYRKGVTDFQRAIVDDPPEIFLVWGERARAVSRRFDVVRPEDGRDVLNTLRLWRPATVQQLASRN